MVSCNAMNMVKHTLQREHISIQKYTVVNGDI